MNFAQFLTRLLKLKYFKSLVKPCHILVADTDIARTTRLKLHIFFSDASDIISH